VENLSLGLKLLMQTAVLATPPGSPTHSLQVGPADTAAFKEIGLPGLAMVIPAALAAFASFHEGTLHQLAASDYAFHPVHTNFIYG
jgi:hypothetical protein